MIVSAGQYQGPFQRTEHYYGAGIDWIPMHRQVLVDPNGFPEFQAELGYALGRYRPGRTYFERWNYTPLGPSFAERLGAGTAVRSGDSLRIAPTLFSASRSASSESRRARGSPYDVSS